MVKKEGLKGGGYYVEYGRDEGGLMMEVLKDCGVVIVD